MNASAKRWREDRGSIDFIQVVVGLMIISAAAVGTLQSLYYGYQKLDYEMRYRKAISLARSEVEYIQGRIHTDYDPNVARDVTWAAGTLARPEIWLLDKRDTTTTFDDVYCQVSFGSLNPPVDLPETGVGPDFYRIQVYVRWWEPGDNLGAPPKQVHFTATMAPAAL